MWTNMWSKTNSSCNIFSKISPIMYNKKTKNSSVINVVFLIKILDFLGEKITDKNVFNSKKILPHNQRKGAEKSAPKNL